MIHLRALRLPLPESDLDDEQLLDILASPLYLQEREASADRSRVCHSHREKSVSSASHFRTACRSVLTQKKAESRDRESISSGHQTDQGQDEALSRLSGSENAARLALEEQSGHLLADAKIGSIKTRM